MIVAALVVSAALAATPFEVAFERFQAQDWEGALGAARVWLRTHPDDADALGIAGIAALRLGGLDDAERDLRRATTLEPGRVPLLQQFGHVLLEKAGRANLPGEARAAAAEAAGIYARVLEIAPSDPRATEARAVALAAAGRIDEAVAAHAAWAALSPDAWAPRVSLAATYARAGLWAEFGAVVDGWLDEDPWRAAEPVVEGLATLARAGRHEDLARFAARVEAKASGGSAAWGAALLQLLALPIRDSLRPGLLRAAVEHLDVAAAADLLGPVHPPARVDVDPVRIDTRALSGDPRAGVFLAVVSVDGTLRSPVAVEGSDPEFERRVREVLPRLRFRAATVETRPVSYPVRLRVAWNGGRRGRLEVVVEPSGFPAVRKTP